MQASSLLNHLNPAVFLVVFLESPAYAPLRIAGQGSGRSASDPVYCAFSLFQNPICSAETHPQNIKSHFPGTLPVVLLFSRLELQCRGNGFFFVVL